MLNSIWEKCIAVAEEYRRITEKVLNGLEKLLSSNMQMLNTLWG